MTDHEDLVPGRFATERASVRGFEPGFTREGRGGRLRAFRGDLLRP